MRLVSLCSGYGGLDLAVEAVFGATTVAFAELEPAPTQVFARHWPDARPLGDLTAVDWTTVEADVVCAGFPCQDLSYAGKGRGIVADSRSGLWYAIEHALGVLRPRHVVLENVAAIVARRPGLDVVLAGLARLGFDARWTCVRASDVGAPHRRERWFLAATHPGRERHGRGQERREMGRLDRQDAGEARQRQRSRQEPGDRGTTAPANAPVLGRPEGWPEPDRGRATAGGEDAPADAASDAGWVAHGDPTAPADADHVGCEGPLPGARGNDGRGDPRPAWGDYGPAVTRWEHVLGRPAPAPTDERGRLSPRFVEFLMGLPAGWVTDVDLSRSQALKCLGNGVVPAQAAYALTSLLEPQEVAA